MKWLLDLLFGWLHKPNYLLTPIDEFIILVEVVLLFILIIVVYAFVSVIVDSIKEKRKRK